MPEEPPLEPEVAPSSSGAATGPASAPPVKEAVKEEPASAGVAPVPMDVCAGVVDNDDHIDLLLLALQTEQTKYQEKISELQRHVTEILNLKFVFSFIFLFLFADAVQWLGL